MLKKYRAEVFDKVVELGFKPEDFHIREIEKNSFSSMLSVAIVQNPKLRFEFHQAPTSFHNFQYCYVQYAPHYPKTNLTPSGTMGFQGVLEKFEYWIIESLKLFWEEVNSQDKWELYKSGELNIDSDYIEFEEEEYFTQEERNEIKSKIETTKAHLIEQYEFNDTQIAIINSKLDYLIEKSESMSKFDWTNFAIGIVANIITALTLDTAVGNKVGQILLEIFRNIKSIGAG